MIVKINGYEIDTEKKHVAAQGFWYVATKGGKQFFLKQYNPAKPIPPSEGSGSVKVYEKNLRNFEKRAEYRKKINTTIRSFTTEGGNIVVPREEFIAPMPDESGKNLVFYWEATMLIPNVIPDEELESKIRSLDTKDKLLILATAAGALNTVHQHGIVHSDLKLGNVLLAVNSNNKVVAKLIDFDGSYFINNKDTLIAGDEVYCSPELLMFYNAEDDDGEFRDRLNEKSDIFSLGLIYHLYLSGSLPEGIELPPRLQKAKEKGNPLHCCEILLAGGKLKLSDKITSLKYRLLIQDMLKLDPAERPSAFDVLSRIKEPEVEFSVDEPWPEHKIVLKSDKLRAANYALIRKTTVDGDQRYELIKKSGETAVLTKDEIVAKGFAELERKTTFDEPWPEHDITIDIDKIKSKGFVSLERAEFKSNKGYYLYRANNTRQFFMLNNMLLFGLAAKKSGAGVSSDADKAPRRSETEASGFVACEPWPEDNITFNSEALLARKFVRAERAEMNGKKGYYLYNTASVKKFFLLNMLEVFGFISKK